MGISVWSNSSGAAIDEVEYTDLGSGYWLTQSMKKNGSTQTMPTSATWVTLKQFINNPAASGGALTQMGNVVSTTGSDLETLKAFGAASGRTVTASVPFTGNTGGRANQCRIKQNGTVIGTGSTVSTSSGTLTCTVSSVTVAEGDAFLIELASTGASSGTVTANTPTLTIT
jgi:hypothetical protein